MKRVGALLLIFSILPGCASTADKPTNYDATQSARIRAYIDADITLYPARSCYPWRPSKNDTGIRTDGYYGTLQGVFAYWGLNNNYGYSVGMPMPEDRRKQFFDENIIPAALPLTITLSLNNKSVNNNPFDVVSVVASGISTRPDAFNYRPGTMPSCPFRGITFTPQPGHDYEVSLSAKDCKPQVRELITEEQGNLKMVEQAYELSPPCNF